jgi:hypothetical protein
MCYLPLLFLILSDKHPKPVSSEDYLKESFSIWQKDVKVIGSNVYMDYDIPFGNYINGGCIPRIAPMVAVVNQTSGTLTFTPPSPACAEGGASRPASDRTA